MNSLGERAGNAPLEEVVLGLAKLHGIATGVDLKHFLALSQQVATASGPYVSWQKAWSGRVFTHEAGIHVDGLLKHRTTTRVLTPARWAAATALLLGKHSGPRAVMTVYAGLGVHLDMAMAERPAGAGAPFVLAQTPAGKPQLLNLLSDEEMARHV